jgi:hypothetical protein
VKQGMLCVISGYFASRTHVRFTSKVDIQQCSTNVR